MLGMLLVVLMFHRFRMAPLEVAMFAKLSKYQGLYLSHVVLTLTRPLSNIRNQSTKVLKHIYNDHLHKLKALKPRKD